MISTMSLRTPQGRIIAAIVAIFFFLIILRRNADQSYLPSFPRRMRYSSLKEKMLFSEASWRKSVELRNDAIASHPKSPQIPLFPTKQDVESQTPVWDYFPPAWQCPLDIQRVGRFGDGGKWMCGITKYEAIPQPKAWTQSPTPKIPSGGQDGLVMYSFGVRDDSTFEAAILERVPSARIWGFDFSVDSWGPQIPLRYQNRTFFSKVGLGDVDAPEQDPPFLTFQTLMAQNNHTYIDILKIDVEGSEFKSLDAFMDHIVQNHEGEGDPVIPIGQVMIELHVGHFAKDVNFYKFNKWWSRLEAMGMRPTWMELNLLAVTLPPSKAQPDCTEYVWVNVMDKNNVLWKE